jgi:hypothetical protein
MSSAEFGFYSVLARLDVEVDFASVERAAAQYARELCSGPNAWRAGVPTHVAARVRR